MPPSCLVPMPDPLPHADVAMEETTRTAIIERRVRPSLLIGSLSSWSSVAPRLIGQRAPPQGVHPTFLSRSRRPGHDRAKKSAVRVLDRALCERGEPRWISRPPDIRVYGIFSDAMDDAKREVRPLFSPQHHGVRIPSDRRLDDPRMFVSDDRGAREVR